MSGFFMVRRDVLERAGAALSGRASRSCSTYRRDAHGATCASSNCRIAFGERQHGESKLDTRVALDFAALVLAKLTGDAVSFRFLLFCLVGLTGIAIHMATLQLAVTTLSFGAAQAVATVAAITWNFVLNNMFTYRDQRLAGWRSSPG